jgi:ribonuclease R
MKKHTRDEKPKSHQNQRSGSDEKIIFGTYNKKDGREVVTVGRVDYPVGEIKHNVKSLTPGDDVKAIVRPGKAALILRALGPKLSLKARIERLLKETNLPIEFPDEVIAEADLFGSEVKKSDTKNRRDLTKIPLCTIDGETAKDFDDAVYACKKGNNIEVVVAIADVSHYVKNNSALDEEALLRGTSVYYPGQCVPMLPEQLSNGLCSLKPDVVRLALSVSFEIGPRGKITKRRIEEAVIKSAARLTYNQVQDFYDEKPTKIQPKIKASLSSLKEAADILRKVREKRGAIDFDIVESNIALDDLGEPLSIHPQDRLLSHKIIEDLMVASNEIVAEFFEEHQVPGLFRVHEQPDQEKLGNFYTSAQAFGVMANTKGKTHGTINPKDLQKLMASFQKSPHKDVLTTLMLRAMMQARYSEQNLMHFGLASTAYLHFTSPIRRYADLIVHRQLRHVLFEKNLRKMLSERELAEIARSISDKEFRATDLERKIDRLFASTYMSSHVGEEFGATITACTEFGFFARVAEHHVEGLVHIATISKSHVNFIPEKMALVVSGSNIKYMVGDKVRVKLINVNIERGHIDFELAQEEKPEVSKPKRNPRAIAKKSFKR